MRYDPVRWVCQCKSSLCDGIFYVYDEAHPCPLWPHCKGQKHQLEYLYPQQSVYQRKLHLAEPERYMPHAKRALDLRRAFVPDEVRRLNQASYERNKDKRAAITKRERAEASLSEERRLRTDIPLPPCGMACEDEDGCCPYDDDCHFPNWEEEQIELTKQAKRKARNREAYARLKANPEKLAAKRAKENDRRRRARAAKAEADGKLKPSPPPTTPEAKRTAKNERDRLRHASHMASDPEYAARCHAKNAAAYAAMTPEQREAKRVSQREYERQKRAAETPEQREARRAAQREREQQKRAAETPEQREARLAKRRETLRRSRAKKSPEQLEMQRAKEREARRARVAAMTPEERAEANAKQRARYWKRKSSGRGKESEG